MERRRAGRNCHQQFSSDEISQGVLGYLEGWLLMGCLVCSGVFQNLRGRRVVDRMSL